MSARKAGGEAPTEKAPPEKAPEEQGEQLDFDGRLQRLEEIVGELEAGGLGLEAAIERYREGISLLGRCRDALAGFRRQVEELSREAEQGLSAFEADPDLGGRGAGPEPGR